MEILRPVIAVLFGALIAYLFLIAWRMRTKKDKIEPKGWLAIGAVFIVVALMLWYFGV